MKFGKLLVVCTLFFSAIQGVVDNRYMPLHQYDFQHTPDKKSVAGVNVFLITGDSGYNNFNSVELSLPEIFGKYDLIKAARAVAATGATNPLPSSWQMNSTLEWNSEGKFTGQGVWLGAEKYLGKHLSLGGKIPFMSVNSQMEFKLTEDLKRAVSSGTQGEAALYNNLNKVNSALGFNEYQWSRTGFGDLELYLRLGLVRDYFLKCKHIDFSAKLGAILPIGDKVDLDSPIAIPFGGHNHPGMFFEVDFNCELKDDWHGGFWFSLSKRFAKTQQRRVPIKKELPQFGALKRDVKVGQGLTISFSPYVWISDIRDGLGARVSYTMAKHYKDSWDVQPLAGSSLVANTDKVLEVSGWHNEYFTVGLVYDLAQTKRFRKYEPRVYLDCDIPAKLFEASWNVRAYRLTFGFEFNF